MAIDFRSLTKIDIPEGLVCVQMGPNENKRITKLAYTGPKANGALDLVSGHGREGIPDHGDVSLQSS